MIYAEVPSDQEVVEALRAIGGSSTASKLCDRLVADGHPRRDSQLAIQRAAERSMIVVNSDWTLSLPVEARAA